MTSFQMYCGANSIIVGRQEKLPADYTKIEFYDDFIPDLLAGKKKGNFWIEGDAEQLINTLKTKYKYVEAAGGYVLNNLGQSLVIFRNGLWDLPKGHVEPGESIENAAVREVMEETGISEPKIVEKLTDTYHFYMYDNKPPVVFKKTYWYLMSNEGNGKTNPQTEEGITACLWVDDGRIDELINKTHRNLKILFQFKKDGRI